MTLAELRKLSIKKQLKIHFPLKNGMECIITEHGIAQVPELKGIPDFNLEQELASTTQFLLEPAVTDKKNASKPRPVTREELSQMTATGAVAASHDDHDDE